MLTDTLSQLEAWLRGLPHPYWNLLGAAVSVATLLLIGRDALRWYIDQRAHEIARFYIRSPAVQHQFRQFLEAGCQEGLEDARVAHQQELRAMEARVTDFLRDSLRDLVVEVRRSGIPLQVTVASRNEADLIRETVGPVPVRVSKKSRKDPEVLPSPPPTNGEALSVWDRLSAQEPEEPEEPCPTSENPPDPQPKSKAKKKA